MTAGGPIFYVSYAHSAPMPDKVRGTDTDHWVRMVFQDLSKEIRRIRDLPPRAVVGVLGGMLQTGEDWRESKLEALSTAQVFVPLYSPGYLARTWPRREHESFVRRLEAAGARVEDHVAPVLWIPFPPDVDFPELHAALELGHGVPAYAENGLRALRMLAGYRTQYEVILSRLAHRIVGLAGDNPLKRSPAPDVRDVPAVLPEAQSEAPYVVRVLAPTAANHPDGAPADAYGAGSPDWRPFGTAQEMPIAEYAATVAERLGLMPRIVGVPPDRTGAATAGPEANGLSEKAVQNAPGMLLIDPWFAALPDGEATLSAALATLPEWVTPLVVLNRRDVAHAERGALLRERVLDMLRRAGNQRTRTADEAEACTHLMPVLVGEARRQFLRQGPIWPPKGGRADRPRLAGHTPPTSPGSEEDRDD
ncbi:MAG: hypothetical protein HOV79_26510 [Hamadaea sp.]|nr:hypothetical protein [Hamadaea sp.]